MHALPISFPTRILHRSFQPKTSNQTILQWMGTKRKESFSNCWNHTERIIQVVWGLNCFLFFLLPLFFQFYLPALNTIIIQITCRKCPLLSIFFLQNPEFQRFQNAPLHFTYCHPNLLSAQTVQRMAVLTQKFCKGC